MRPRGCPENDVLERGLRGDGQTVIRPGSRFFVVKGRGWGRRAGECRGGDGWRT